MKEIENAIEVLKAVDADTDKEMNDSIRLGIAALEKQIPMEPEYIDDDACYFICPSCRESICSSDELITHKFCLNCGQAIDWSIKDLIAEKLGEIIEREEMRIGGK